MPVSTAEKFKVYILSLLLAPFGIVWFFKFRKSTDPERKKLSTASLFITLLAVCLMFLLVSHSAKKYMEFLNTFTDGSYDVLTLY